MRQQFGRNLLDFTLRVLKKVEELVKTSIEVNIIILFNIKLFLLEYVV